MHDYKLLVARERIFNWVNQIIIINTV